MTIIKIEPYENGAHDNQTIMDVTPLTFPIPEGYAYIPESVGTPDTLEAFPFGDITVVNNGGLMTVTSWTPGVVPESPPAPAPSAPVQDQVKAVSDRQDFLEDCIAEMAQVVYN